MRIETVLFLFFITTLLGIFLNPSNIILILVLIELMLFSLILLLIMCSWTINSSLGTIISLNIIALAAVEAAIGLSLVTILYKLKGSISVSYLNSLKG